ncbi:KpsF/GutQ family sugar-phosphate isomerase [Cytobacillus firmus]|uniref:KpsF/GutQ family sugar-phosphate isomerase n=1 Tax=Cytobacillus firmus TaxID=1399 RepID=UPI0029D41D73|nr:KpsF/GutQ family sugar-phosphate isomerase [Cytobacillus firmus]
MNLPNFDFRKTISQVIEMEANEILARKDSICSKINECVNHILNSNGRVVITGIGKSGIIGKKITATLSSTGTPSLFLHPAEGLHGDLGMVTEDDIVIAISNSGETEEILKIIPSIKRIGAKLIAIVGDESSTIAGRADLVVSYGKVEEACPLGLAPTTSSTLTLVIGDALAIALLEAKEFKPENFAVFHPGGSLGIKLLLTVDDVISANRKNPIADINSQVKEVLFKMTDVGLGAINIIDDSGVLKGVLTDGDIRRALGKEENILNQKVESLFNPKPTTIKRDVLAAEALKIMENRKINILPVVDDNNQPIGMIHIQDLIKMGLR